MRIAWDHSPWAPWRDYWATLCLFVTQRAPRLWHCGCRGDEDRQHAALCVSSRGQLACSHLSLRFCDCLVASAVLTDRGWPARTGWGGVGTGGVCAPQLALSSPTASGILQIMPRSTWLSCRRRPSRSQAACSASPSSTATITRSTSSMPGMGAGSRLDLPGLSSLPALPVPVLAV